MEDINALRKKIKQKMEDFSEASTRTADINAELIELIHEYDILIKQDA